MIRNINKKMKREYKQAYEAPKMVRFELKPSLSILADLSIETTPGQDPTYLDDWGDIEDQHWGRLGGKNGGNI
jgi:hypothetical protein